MVLRWSYVRRFGLLRGCSLAALLSSLTAPTALAQSFASPLWSAPRGAVQVGGGYAVSEIDYDSDSSNQNVEVKRKAFFADVAYGVAQSVDVFAQLALITDTEIENIDEDGDGLGLTLGIRALAYQQGRSRFGILASYAYTDETVKEDNVKVTLKTAELRAGPSWSYAVNDAFMPYVSLMVALMEDSEAKTKAGNISAKAGYERDNQISLEGGGNMTLGAALIHFGVTLIGEQTFVIGARTTL